MGAGGNTLDGEGDGPDSYTAREAAELVGVPTATVGEWELRGFLAPGEPDSQRRRYREADVRRMMRIKALTKRYRYRRQVLAALQRGEAAEAASSAMERVETHGLQDSEVARINQEQVDAIVATSPDSVFAQGLDLRYQWFLNPGPPLTDEDIVGKTDIEMVSAGELGGDVENAKARMAMKRRVMETGETLTYDAGFPFQDGWHEFEIICRPWRDRQGNVVGVLGFRRDITDRARAERALQQRLDAERTILEVSASLGGASAAVFEQEIERALARIGGLLHADSCLLAVMDEAGEAFETGFDWRADGTPSTIVPLRRRLRVDDFAWSMKKLKDMQTLVVSDVQDLPPDASRELGSLLRSGARAGLAVPLPVHGKVGGAILVRCNERRDWKPDDISLLGLAAEAIARAVERVRAERVLRASEEQLRRTFDQAPIGAAVQSLEGRYLRANAELCRITGYTEEELKSLAYTDITHPDDREGGEKLLGQLMAGEIDHYEREKRYIRKDGSELWVRVYSGLTRDEAGRALFNVPMVLDISKRRKAEQALKESELMLRTVFEETMSPILLADEQGRYLDGNRAALEFLECTLDELRTRTVWDFTPVELFPQAAEEHSPFIGRRTLETPYLIDGRVKTLLLNVVPLTISGRTVLYGIGHDITERKKADEALQYLSFHDRLTGLYNRAYFEEEVGRLERGREYPITVVACDVDGLKLINDTMGHHRGDDLLREFAGALSASFRQSDVVARVGGDEFGVVLPRTGAEAAESLCVRLESEVLTRSSTHDGIPLSVSIGIATALDARTPLAEVVKRADAEMYRDKLHHGPSGAHGIVRALITALAIKDNAAEGHLARVKDSAQALGRACGLSAREMAEVGLLAEVHDLGKVGVPDHVLLKPGPLTAQELEQMRQHSVLGFRDRSSVPELSHIADLVLHHHEWWDGSGYPTGLRGEEIPVACRILAIADAYDSMTSDRPYHKAMAVSDAVSELKRCAGTQFDPKLVETFITAITREASPR